jgi:ubiquinone/menaquinone biosynthesis C-methylase UbiE
LNEKSLWSQGSKLNREQAKEMVENFEKRSQYPDQVKINNFLKDFISPKSGEHLLEIGSGSGVVSRLVATNLLPNGKLVGIELSSEIVSLAYKYITKESIKKVLKYKEGNAMDLPFDNNLFDGAFAARLLLHVPEPQKVVSELKRVIKSGGRIILMDWDFGTLAVDHSNRELTRRILNWRTDNKDGNNWSGRQLYRLLKAEKFKDIKIKPIVSLATDENNSLTHSLFHAASGALKNKIISKEKHESWMNQLKERLNSGTFFASITYFLVKAHSP